VVLGGETGEPTSKNTEQGYADDHLGQEVRLGEY